MLKKAGTLTFIRVAGDVVNLLLFIVLSRHFGPEGIGVYAYAMAIAGLAYAAISFGLEDLAIRECARLGERERSDLVGRLLGLQMLIAMAVLAVLFGLLAVKGHSAAESFIILALFAYQFALGLVRTLFAPAFAKQKMIWPLAAEVLSRVLVVAGSVWLIFQADVSLAGAVSPYPAGGLILLILAACSARRNNGSLRVIFPWRDAGKTIRAAWPFGAIVIIYTLQARVSFILLSILLGKEATGLYASSYKFVEFGILPLVFLAFAQYPNLTRQFSEDREEFHKLSNRLYLLSLSVGALLTWGLIFVVPGVITVLLGPSFQGSVAVLKALSVLGIVMAADIPAGRLMLAAHLQKARVKCILAGVVANILAALVLIPPFGLYGAVLATVAGQLSITVLSLLQLHFSSDRLLDRRADMLTCGLLLVGAAVGWALLRSGAEEWQAAFGSLLGGGAILAVGAPVLVRRIQGGRAGKRNGKEPRVCFLLESYYPVVGGMETQARLLAEDFARRGLAVMVVTRRSDPALPRFEIQEGIRIYRCPPGGSGHRSRWALLFTCLPTLIRRHRDYDLLHVMGFRVLGMAAVPVARMLGKRSILRAENNGEMSGEFFTAGLCKTGIPPTARPVRVALGLRNRLIRKSEYFVSISAEITSELVQGGVPPQRIRFIPNSVDTSRFHPVPEEERHSLRQRLGLPADRKVAVFTGRLVSFKGLPLLLDVWQRIVQTDRHILLLLIGGGGADMHNCEAALKEFADRHDLNEFVRFTGDVRNVHEYLQTSDLFVFPTEQEAFGIAVIEAMACALPVVTTPVGGLKDIVTHGKNGLLIEPGNPRQLREAIGKLLKDQELASVLAAAALQTVRERYDRQIVAEKYMELLRETAVRSGDRELDPFVPLAREETIHG